MAVLCPQLMRLRLGEDAPPLAIRDPATGRTPLPVGGQGSPGTGGTAPTDH